MRDVTARAIVERRLAAIDGLNGQLNAMITVTAESARTEADVQDDAAAAGRGLGTLAGVTVSLKDVIHTKGIRTTNGSAINPGFMPEEDAEVVRRLKAQNAIVVGKANLHEFAYGGTTQNPFYGSCRNPWDTGRIPGGSSGGSAAAVASRMCCVSLGTDTAGSGRLPAALCGVTALRPTVGAIPNRGVTPVSLFFDTISPMAMSVTQIMEVFRVLAGPDPRDPFSRAHAFDHERDDFDGRIDRVRLGLPSNYFQDGVDAGVMSAFSAATKMLEDLGAILVPIDLPGASDTPAYFERLFHTDCAFEHRGTYADHANLLGADTRERLETLGRRTSGMDYAEALAAMWRWQWQVERVFQSVDAIIHPTTPAVAPTVNETKSTTAVTRRMAVYLYPWSLAQVPVLSLPMGIAEHDMPCGLSIATRWWNEYLAFRIGDAFQRRTGWHRQAPAIAYDFLF